MHVRRMQACEDKIYLAAPDMFLLLNSLFEKQKLNKNNKIYIITSYNYKPKLF